MRASSECIAQASLSGALIFCNHRTLLGSIASQLNQVSMQHGSKLELNLQLNGKLDEYIGSESTQLDAGIRSAHV